MFGVGARRSEHCQPRAAPKRLLNEDEIFSLSLGILRNMKSRLSPLASFRVRDNGYNLVGVASDAEIETVNLVHRALP